VVQVGLLFWWERKEVMGFLKRALLRSMHAWSVSAQERLIFMGLGNFWDVCVCEGERGRARERGREREPVCNLIPSCLCLCSLNLSVNINVQHLWVIERKLPVPVKVIGEWGYTHIHTSVSIYTYVCHWMIEYIVVAIVSWYYVSCMRTWYEWKDLI
jgi:hypothetical protein